MAKTLRVHILAKELGVRSKAVIDKCNAEGVELKNHMSVVSAGLAESIREWFSAGEDVTTVEVAEAVDLEKVKTPRRVAAKGSDESESRDEGDTAVATVEAPTKVDEAAQPADEPEEQPVAQDEEPEAEQPVVVAEESPVAVVDAPSEQEPTPDEAAAPVAEAPQGDAGDSGEGDAQAQEPAEEPATPAEDVRPAGPQVVPAPAELKGPRVVRVEAPEPVRAPRPRPAAPAASGGGMIGGDMGSSDTARRGRGRGRDDRDSGKAAARSPRRQRGGAEVQERFREWRDQDILERKERLASATGHGLQARRSAEKRRRQSSSAPSTIARKGDIEITAPITLKDFCAAVGVGFNVILGKLINHAGRPFTINESIDSEMAELLAIDLGITLKIEQAKTRYEALRDTFDQRERENLKPRPPVCAMLGHVDHGKTSLLDAIRRTQVASGEAGGITQHIGAYRIKHKDWEVTFLDTPGHEAFTAMRARGADLTDVVVLVVAADDGVMPQTAEAINHAKAANVQIVVALNKIDLPGVDLNRIYAQLAEHDLTPSEWGGNTDVIKTSAQTGEGIEDLIEHLSTLSELLELQADPTVPARAAVIEAQLKEGRGSATQVLVREGTLKRGQFVVCGPGYGRVRTLLDDRGKRLEKATPGMPVEVLGLDELPQAGDNLFVVDNLKQAKEVAEEVRQQRRAESLTTFQKATSLEDLIRTTDSSEIPELNVIIKADVQGSVEMLKDTLAQLPDDKAKLRILHNAVGAITEADVDLARASSAIIIGFHVVADDRARQMADHYGVEVRLYRVLYNITEDLELALAGLLEPEIKEEVQGKVEVRQVFNVSRVGTIAGCMVMDGVITRNSRVRLIRDGRVVVENKEIQSLKRFKDDAKEVRAGLECGVKIEGYDDLKPGDIIEPFKVVEIAAKL